MNHNDPDYDPQENMSDDERFAEYEEMQVSQIRCRKKTLARELLISLLEACI